MKYQKTIFRQLLGLIHRDKFQKYVDRYDGDKKTYKLKCWDQFIALTFAQIRKSDSLRDLEIGLKSNQEHWYHLNTNGIKRSTLSDANKNRDHRIYEDLFQSLLNRCKTYSRKHYPINNPIRSIDSSTIELCYSLFPWAKYRTQKGAIKLHLQLEHNTYLPEIAVITDGKKGDITIAREFPVIPDSIYTVDRGYIDYQWLHRIHTSGAFFVTRAKKDMNYSIIGQQESYHEDVIADYDIQTPWIHKRQPSKKPKYPDILRMVIYQDPDTNKEYRFLTNITDINPETIALIYKQRWKIELFFKWIKQHLKVKTFIGTSKNAVLTQIWIALIVYLIAWYFKHQTKFEGSLLAMIRLLNETLLKRVHLLEILGLQTPKTNNDKGFEQLLLGFT
jgi:hypothetical protein